MPNELEISNVYDLRSESFLKLMMDGM
jgi:hypothetical protein